MRRSDSTHLSQGRPGHQRAAAALLGTLLAATGLTTAQATGDITAPTVQVTSPAPDQLFKLGSLTFQGSAADDAGVASVTYSIEQRPNGDVPAAIWLQSAATCAWGRPQQLLGAALGSPGAQATSWTATLSCLTSGDYLLTAQATVASVFPQER